MGLHGVFVPKFSGIATASGQPIQKSEDGTNGTHPSAAANRSPSPTLGTASSIVSKEKQPPPTIPFFYPTLASTRVIATDLNGNAREKSARLKGFISKKAYTPVSESLTEIGTGLIANRSAGRCDHQPLLLCKDLV